MPPAIDATKHRPTHQCRFGDPFDVSLHRAQPLQGRRLISLAEVVAITLAARQIKADAGTGAGLHVFNLKPAQLVAAKAAPEAQQDQRHVAPGPQQSRSVAFGPCDLHFQLQTTDHLLQVLKLQGFGLFFLGRMQRTDALEHLAHHRRLGGVGKTLAVVPLRQGRQAQFQRIDRQHAGMRHQVARHAVAGCRQKPAPRDFEVFDGCPIAATGVVASRGLQIAIQIAHRA
ncbi:hypothetical protein D3C71_1227840 [compost metagenome]